MKKGRWHPSLFFMPYQWLISSNSFNSQNSGSVATFFGSMVKVKNPMIHFYFCYSLLKFYVGIVAKGILLKQITILQ